MPRNDVLWLRRENGALPVRFRTQGLVYTISYTQQGE